MGISYFLVFNFEVFFIVKYMYRFKRGRGMQYCISLWDCHVMCSTNLFQCDSVGYNIFESAFM